MEKYNPSNKEKDYKIIKDFISKLENIKLEEEAKTEENKGNNIDENNNICPICSDSQVDSHIYPCGHPICRNCLLQHTLENKLCPFCRSEIKGIKEDQNIKI